MIISQFRTDAVLKNILKRYEEWHTPRSAGSRKIPMGQPGSGREFLQFHRSLLDEFFAWNAVHHAVEAKDLAAWTAVPAELKVPETGWPTPWSGLDLAVAEIRIRTNLPPFANDDELGIFVEITILNWIHGAVAAAPAFNLDPVEQEIISGLQSPQSTWFYKIHGLADLWWNQLLFPKSHFKEIVDYGGSGSGPKSEFKEIVDYGGSGRGFKEVVDNPGGKEFKEIVDAYGGQPATPPILTNLLQRIKALEARLRIKKSPFIKPFQRPNVGASVVRSRRKKNP